MNVGTTRLREARAPDVTRIRLRFLFASECYLVQGDGGSVLIDTGLSRRRGVLLHRLAAEGCEPGDLSLVVLTHAHADHAGSCRFLQSEYGVPVAVHPGDAGKAERGDMFWRDDRGPTVAESLAKVLLRPFGMGGFEPFAPDVLLTEGQDLSEHGIDATVVHFPGHSPGSIGVLTAWGDLFCGDLLTSTSGPKRNTIIDEQSDYSASVERLRDLDVQTVYPGHGECFALEELWRAESG